MLNVTSAARTDIGRRRTLNEDSVLAGQVIWAVADGMGGHAAGDVASAIVIEVLREIDRDLPLRTQDLSAALARANEQILIRVGEHPETSGMGSTVAGLASVVVGGADHWAIFNVGDSRVYRCSGGRLARATVDHSETEELIMEGRITEEQARGHVLRNIITRSIGTNPAPSVDLWVLPPTPGDRFLICSDGLSSEITDGSMAEVLLNVSDPYLAASDLVDRALAAGGRDNISAIVVDLDLGSLDGVDESTQPRTELRKER